MSHSVDSFFSLLTIKRVGVKVVYCQARPVHYIFQPCGTKSSFPRLPSIDHCNDSRRKIVYSIYVLAEQHFPFRYYCQRYSWRCINYNWCNLFCTGIMWNVWIHWCDTLLYQLVGLASVLNTYDDTQNIVQSLVTSLLVFYIYTGFMEGKNEWFQKWHVWQFDQNYRYFEVTNVLWA